MRVLPCFLLLSVAFFVNARLATSLADKIHCIDSVDLSYLNDADKEQLEKTFMTALDCEGFKEAERLAKEVIESGLKKEKREHGKTYRWGLRLLAMVYVESHRDELAEKTYRRDLEYVQTNKFPDKDVAMSLRKLGLFYEDQHQWAKAAATFTECRLREGEPRLYDIFSAAYREARDYYKAGYYRAAETSFLHSQGLHKNWNAVLALAECYRLDNRPKEAEIELMSLLSDFRFLQVYPIFWMRLSKVYTAEGCVQKAKDCDKKLLHLLPRVHAYYSESMELATEIGLHLRDSGHLESAQSLSQSLLKDLKKEVKETKEAVSSITEFHTVNRDLTDQHKLLIIFEKELGNHAATALLRQECAGLSTRRPLKFKDRFSKGVTPMSGVTVKSVVTPILDEKLNNVFMDKGVRH